MDESKKSEPVSTGAKPATASRPAASPAVKKAEPVKPQAPVSKPKKEIPYIPPSQDDGFIPSDLDGTDLTNVDPASIPTMKSFASPNGADKY